MTLKRGPSVFWTWAHRLRVARARMPFWRVVVEAKLDRAARKWPKRHDAAVTAVFVWAQTLEEAEALASLALEEEGLRMQTADATRCPPCAAPSKTPRAMLRTGLRFLDRVENEPGARGPSRWGARA
jgi:hypothetical protein